jgi:lysylphosphatidylglycerol synthetase-like protein (DUF2156 family)
VQQQKRCPQCGLASPLLAKFCANCGHQFRTDFTNRTQMISSPATLVAAPSTPSQSEPVSPLVPLVLSLFALLFLFLDPLIALILSLATLLYAHIRLRGVMAFAVSIAVLVAVTCGVIAGYRAGWDMGKHRADVLEYHYPDRSQLPYLPGGLR